MSGFVLEPPICESGSASDSPMWVQALVLLSELVTDELSATC